MLDSAGSNPATIANLIIHTVMGYEENKLRTLSKSYKSKLVSNFDLSSLEELNKIKTDDPILVESIKFINEHKELLNG